MGDWSPGPVPEGGKHCDSWAGSWAPWAGRGAAAPQGRVSTQVSGIDQKSGVRKQEPVLPGVVTSPGRLWEFLSEQSRICPTAEFEHLFGGENVI